MAVFLHLVSLCCFLAFFLTAQGTSRGKVSRTGGQLARGHRPGSVGQDTSAGDLTNHGDNDNEVEVSDKATQEESKEGFQKRLVS
jgi:hypothetical protein